MSRLGRCVALVCALTAIHAQDVVKLSSMTPPLTAREKVLDRQVGRLRSLSDKEWRRSVAELAAEIQKLPFSPGKQWLLDGISLKATEGDAGHAALQTIGDTLVDVASHLPLNQRDWWYERLARLVHYEQVTASPDSPHYREALTKLESADAAREKADFTLTDLKGGQWTLRELRGKVVLVNFWATWCPPCRREMPDLEKLQARFSAKGLLILALSSEGAATIAPFIAAGKFTYPILLDPEQTVYKRYQLDGIPQSFVYDRTGKLVAQAADRRTLGQLLDMLKHAGLE